MTTPEERIQILRMIETGQINAEEGARLLEALESAGTKAAPEIPGRGRWFRVRVTDIRSGKNKVNVNIPMGLVNVGMRMGARFAPEVNGVSVEEIVQAVKDGAYGKIVDIEDNEEGERVEIYVE
jgi:hypothetical protein